jgi:hypothetical protein
MQFRNHNSRCKYIPPTITLNLQPPNSKFKTQIVSSLNIILWNIRTYNLNGWMKDDGRLNPMILWITTK